MRKILMLLAVMSLSVAACTPGAAPTQENEEPLDPPTDTPAPVEPTSEEISAGPTEEAVIKQLAESLGLEPGDISIVRSEETEFADACLGIAVEGVMCAQVVTPGKIIVLEADGIEYEYHTSEEGRQIQPASLALVWRREGGIAGFCDTLVVFRSGEVLASKCGAQSEAEMGTLAAYLDSRERQQFAKWITAFGEEKLDASDPKGVADRMLVTLEFFGMGDRALTEAEEQILIGFAQDLYQTAMR